MASKTQIELETKIRTLREKRIEVGTLRFILSGNYVYGVSQFAMWRATLKNATNIVTAFAQGKFPSMVRVSQRIELSRCGDKWESRTFSVRTEHLAEEGYINVGCKEITEEQINGLQVLFT